MAGPEDAPEDDADRRRDGAEREEQPRHVGEVVVVRGVGLRQSRLRGQ